MMPITAITIENFKCIQEPVRIEFKPVTLLFGPNSSGKSTIIQALQYSLEIFGRNNLDPSKTMLGGKSVDLGGFETLVHKHDLTKPIRLKFELDLHNEDLPQYDIEYERDENNYVVAQSYLEFPMRATAAWVEITVQWNELLRMPSLTSYSVGINEDALATVITSADGKHIFLVSMNPFNPVFLDDITPDQAHNLFRDLFAKEGSFDIDQCKRLGLIFNAFFFNINTVSDEGIPGITEPIPIMAQGSALPILWGKTLEFPDHIFEVRDDLMFDRKSFLSCLNSLIVGPAEMVGEGLHRLFYVGPIREIPPRNYLPEKTPELSRWSSGLMGWDVLYNAENTFVESVNKWLTHEDRLNTGYSIEVKRFREIGEDDPISIFMSEGIGLEEMEVIQTRMTKIPIKSRVAIREEKTGVELMPQDIGVGISQLLPVVVCALHLNEGIVTIEQPELHIHPALQVALGDLFISQVQEKTVCFLLETHSEHLMLRFLRRIRETAEDELPPGKWPLKPEQIAVYHVEQGEEGVTLTKIRIDEGGEFIDRWPKGFFSEREDELLY